MDMVIPPFRGLAMSGPPRLPCRVGCATFFSGGTVSSAGSCVHDRGISRRIEDP